MLAKMIYVTTRSMTLCGISGRYNTSYLPNFYFLLLDTFYKSKFQPKPACCTRTVISLLLHPAEVLFSPIVNVCYFRDVYPFIYFIIPMYVHHLGLYCISFYRFLISKINIALH